MNNTSRPVFPDPREESKLPALGGYRPHRCDICGCGFNVGQQFYSDAPNSVVHTSCRLQKLSRETK
jgi:hypothetical protein